jgi:hypothetical protein
MTTLCSALPNGLRFNFRFEGWWSAQSVEVSVDAQALLTTTSSSIGEVAVRQASAGSSHGPAGCARFGPHHAGHAPSIPSAISSAHSPDFHEHHQHDTGWPERHRHSKQCSVRTTTMNPDLIGEVTRHSLSCRCGNGSRQRTGAGPHTNRNEPIQRSGGLECSQHGLVFQHVAQ